MAKLTVEEPIKPVITKAKQKLKAKINKSKSNAAKAEAIKQTVVALNKNKEKKIKPIIKVEEKEDEQKSAAPVVKDEKKSEPKNATPVIKEGKKDKLKNASPLAKVVKKNKKNIVPAAKIEKKEEENKNEVSAALDKEKKIVQNLPPEELAEKYPILKNKDLVTKFLGVTMTNNQKGRLRQQLRDNLKGTSESILPDVIHNKIKSIVKDTESLSETELRKIRILYNMLKLATSKESNGLSKVTKNKKNKKNNKEKKNNTANGIGEVKENGEGKGDIKKENVNKKKITKKEVKNDKDGETNSDEKKQNENKVKGPKRYVAFVGNLPLDIDREKLMQHFSDLKDHIVDVRIPKVVEGKKSAIAYVELKNEPSYELALSKHHSMLNNRRINVLYSAQQNTKLSKTEVKGKAAKMVALQKSGKLAGSVPLNKKRSQRRAKAKNAQAKSDD